MESDKITMTDEEIIKDYPRLKLEYTRLHEDYRRLKSKQCDISVVSGTLILTLDDAEVFFNEILNPKEANDALKKANKCH